MAFFSRATYCIVTGASSGLGRELAIQLANEWTMAGYAAKSTVVLVARNEANLAETKEIILKSTAPNPCNVDIVPADLSDINGLPNVCSQVLRGYSKEKYQQAVIFHNAGSIGDIVRPTADQTNPFEVTNYLTLNYTSMWVLTTKFLSHVDETQPRFIMNMSSLVAKRPFGRLAAYSSIKAARNVFFESLSIEYPNARILNYSPGPCDTDMLHTVRNDVTLKETRDAFVDIKVVLSVKESICKLIQILKDDNFKNAAIIDYFD